MSAKQRSINLSSDDRLVQIVCSETENARLPGGCFQVNVERRIPSTLNTTVAADIACRTTSSVTAPPAAAAKQ